MSSCQICEHGLRVAEAHRTACGRCEHRIRAWLQEIPKQLPLLEASLQLDAAPGTGRGGIGRAHSPLPLREDILTLLGPAAPGPVHDQHSDQAGPTPIHAVLHAWADRLAHELGRDLPPLRPGHDYTRYLAAHLPYALTRDWIALMHAELADLITRIRTVTHTEPRRRPKTAPCPHCEAFALFETDWQPYIDCEACGLLLTATEYLDHAQAVLPPLYRISVLMVATNQTAQEVS